MYDWFWSASLKSFTWDGSPIYPVWSPPKTCRDSGSPATHTWLLYWAVFIMPPTPKLTFLLWGVDEERERKRGRAHKRQRWIQYLICLSKKYFGSKMTVFSMIRFSMTTFSVIWISTGQNKYVVHIVINILTFVSSIRHFVSFNIPMNKNRHYFFYI